MYKPIVKLLKSHGFNSWVCGGTARDLKLGLIPSGHDIAVDTTLNELQKHFKDKVINIDEYNTSIEVSFMENEYTLYPLKKISLINTYYNFEYTKSIEEDASTRDFTINALFYDPLENIWYDFHDGLKDLESRTIKFINDPDTRILESKARIIRAPILCAILGDFTLDPKTSLAIKNNRLKAMLIHPKQFYSEFTSLLTRAKMPSMAFKLMRSTKLLNVIFPELYESIGIEQSNKSDDLDLFTHIMNAVDSVPIDKVNALTIRLAALTHDIGKPYCKVETDSGMHFYNHEHVGSYLSERRLQIWGYPKNIIEKNSILVKNHLFDASIKKSTSSIKKLINRVGANNIQDLLDLRIADRSGTGRSDISMKKIHLFRDKINEVLSQMSPSNFKLNISYFTLEKLLSKHTDNVTAAVIEAEKFLKKKVIYGRVTNKVTSLRKAFYKVNRIKCPLDKPHLFKVWTGLQMGEADTFPNGNLVCGVYCNFMCNKILNQK